MIRFKFLTGDVNWMEYGGKWISNKQNNGDFDYWLVMEFINMDEACGRDNKGQPRYHVELSAVSPDQAGPENLKKAFECCGWTEEHQQNPIIQVEALSSYGVVAVVWSQAGSNAHKLLKEGRKAAQFQGSMLFGFSMDAPKNKIGTTGWEALRGDLDSALFRTIAGGSPTGRILAKMHGINPDDVIQTTTADSDPQKGQ